MRECTSPYFFHNGRYAGCERFTQAWVYEGESLYEIIRVKDGVPLFLEDHLERLAHTALLRDLPLPEGKNEMSGNVCRFIKKISLKEGNIKVVVNKPPASAGKRHYLIYQVAHHYPSPEMYQQGVHCLLHYAERSQPTAKVINHRLRNVIYKHLIETAHYEALLVNRREEVTEGSRSNVFFIHGDQVVTAPENMVLPGISRAKVIDLCHQEHLSLKFSPVKTTHLSRYDAVFLTGTSIGVLPVAGIAGMTFQVHHPVLARLMALYEDTSAGYIQQHLPA